jgi:hypothetical protein
VVARVQAHHLHAHFPVSALKKRLETGSVTDKHP